MPISPNQGPVSGGQTVTITGVNLAAATSVLFGSNQATITANTPTSITVTSPTGNGAVDVVVTTAGGSSNPLSYFYILPPIIESLDQTSGNTAGGNTVNIFGRYLSTATTVNCGSNTATPTIVNDSQISFVVPAGSSAGQVTINVVTAGGSSSGLTYTYIDPPTITSLSPTSGSTIGGDTITITGTNLSTTTSVTFGGTAASFGVISSTQITAITPPGTAGSVDVTITTTAGSATASGGYTYANSPGI
jgi:hypothetical protein